MSVKVDNLSAIENPNGKSNVIGFLCWYSVGEDLYSRDDLRVKILNAGLKEEFLPNQIRPSDAFRRATKAIERTKIDAGNGVLENYLIRNVTSNNEITQRNLVKEVRDTKGQRLDYVPSVAELVFDRKADQFQVRKRPNDGSIADELVEEAERLFQVYLQNHNANTVRSSVLGILKSLSPTPVRPSGGVYFVPAKNEKALRCMVNFLQSLKRGEGFMIPLIDSTENRDMVKEKLADHLRKTLEDCGEILKNPNVQKVQVRSMIDDARRIVKDFKEYREIVTGAVDDMENHIDLIRQQVQLLLEKGAEK
ncbi:DUF6744 family protein [Anaerobacillus isosaccharinicus]|uniref:Uncharacterized protein n=1 Tax=Anaerobacillus isosaccharinicus TaxID=1532552 RepID=A0A1S2KY37_9BACI|nr:DUF6744 family protein [Anaerobacillus isosaccharinicus]MBA5588917.1 hypothetical protein [Anaerobacillus isosaccharinicus]QOY37672.1 hypothetical protein AWH56_008865 [Anaerobacillus isosaccharinicus]